MRRRLSAASRVRTRVRRVDDRGIVLLTTGDRPLDVRLDGRRVWTFWAIRDTERGLPAPTPLRRIAWPAPLARHLDGVARVTVCDSVTGAGFFDREVRLGTGGERIRVQSQAGVDLGIDKSGRLVPTFAGRSADDLAALMDATESVIQALREAGVEPFLAYGTLLGAVREGAVLGHDSDADLGYVSRCTHPLDVVRESFTIQRRLARQGWVTYRYSGAAFKVDVTEGDVTRGLDVFGGFLDDGRLHLMGEIDVPFREEWIRPLTTAELEGRRMPVPAEPERLLEATYGPGWRSPDPAFRFTTPDRTIREFDDWFRGLQPGIRFWERQAAAAGRRAPVAEAPAPSALARRAAREADRLGAEVLDVGAGRGWDSYWLARRGLTVTAYDYVPRGLRQVQERAAAEGLPLDVRRLNLAELRSVLAEGARLAQAPRPRVLLARHVVEATSLAGREALARLCSMALRSGGVLLAEIHLADEELSADGSEGTVDPQEWPLEWMLGRVDVEGLTTLLREAGASRVSVRRLPDRRRPTVTVVGVWAGGDEGSPSGSGDDRRTAPRAAGR